MIDKTSSELLRLERERQAAVKILRKIEKQLERKLKEITC